MSQTQISNRYAKALFELAQEENSLYPVYISLQEIGSFLKKNEDFKKFIHNPLFSIEERTRIIKRTFNDKVPKLVSKFLLYLNLKNRLNILGDIAESIDELFLEKNNQMRVALETPFSLQDDQKQNIQRKLNRKYQKEISLEGQTKPELLGGFRLLAAGTLYDGSIKSQLEQFRQKVSV